MYNTAQNEEQDAVLRKMRSKVYCTPQNERQATVQYIAK